MPNYICKQIDICEHSDKECRMTVEASWQLPHRCPKTKTKIAWEKGD
jgi:hypothetical protein